MILHKVRECIKDEMAKVVDETITCGYGCGNCCHGKVMVHQEEVDVIYDRIKGIDKDKLAAQNADWENSDQTCVLLKDNLCIAHSPGIKPLRCIVHIVDTPAEDCAEGASPSLKNIIKPSVVYAHLRELAKESPLLKLHEALHAKFKAEE